MRSIKLVILDCDGVMFNSNKANIAYYNTLLKYFKLPKMSKDQIDFAQSHTVNEVLRSFTKNIKIFEDMQKYRKDIDYVDFIKLMIIEPTLYYSIMSLRLRFKIAIATNRSNTITQILSIHKIKNLFDFVICSSDVVLPKPDPSMLNKVIEYFDIDAKEAVYVGDSRLDELAANAAQIPFIAYRNKNLNAVKHIDILSNLESSILEYLNK